MHSKILSVLIVDDEVPIREELRLFNWESHNAVLVGEAENGIEAINFCSEYVPDVVITDITMPKMDGIELAHFLRAKYPQIQIVILTAYSDFLYAKEALKVGALDYLVKVMWDEEMLGEILNKARSIILRERHYLYSSREELRWKKSEVFSQFIKARSTSPEQFLTELEDLGMSISYPFRMAKLQINAVAEDIMFIDRMLQQLLAESEQNHNPVFTWFPIKAGQYAFIFGMDSCHIDKLKREMEDLLKRLRIRLNESLPYLSSEMNMNAVFSVPINTSDELDRKWQDVNRIDYLGFFEFEPTVRGIEELNYTPLTPELQNGIERKMSESITEINLLTDFLQQDFIQWCLQMRVHPGDIKSLLLKWRSDWLAIFRVNKQLDPNQLLLQSPTLLLFIQSLVKELKMNYNYEKKYRYEIRNMINLIERNLSDTITLSTISSIVGLSPNYLSRLFREETGKSFNEFVTEIRMEKAINLLKNTNLKVYEIAESIGIPSYRYFSVLFRKWTGSTPKDFRNR